MSAHRPKEPYMHDGNRLHPKLSYRLPEGMGDAMVEFGLFVAVSEVADVDLSHMAWDARTNQAQTVTPAPIDHEQDAV